MIMESIAELKSGLHQFVANIEDVDVLTKLKDYASQMQISGDKIIVHTSDGRSLNQKEYSSDIDKQIKQAESGATISIEDMEKTYE